MDNQNTLRLVGLALRAGRLEVGEDAAADACQYKKARLLLLASDAAEGTVNRALHAAAECGCVPLETPWSKEELRSASGGRRSVWRSGRKKPRGQNRAAKSPLRNIGKSSKTTITHAWEPPGGAPGRVLWCTNRNHLWRWPDWVVS